MDIFFFWLLKINDGLKIIGYYWDVDEKINSKDIRKKERKNEFKDR